MVTKRYKGLKGVNKGYKCRQKVQRVTRGWVGLQGVKKGY